MNRATATIGLALALLGGGMCPPVPAGEAPAPRGAAIELPPMMVEESVSAATWLHAHAGGAEFLSRCSAFTTRDFIAAWLQRMQLIRALVPEEFLGRSDVPTVIILYSQNLEQTISAEIQRELETNARREGESARGERVNIAPNMRLSDRDMHASIIYLDESQFNAAGLSIAPSHVRFLVKTRVPELPAWLIDGIERTWHSADFVMDPITLRPLVWHTQRESDALAIDPMRPRALLPAGELFATEAMRALENRHPRHRATRQATQELFFRWAITSSAATREALWKFAAHAAEAPVTEALFESCFGFDFAELRDRLSDYLPKAVDRAAWIAPGDLPPAPDFEVKPATPSQIARVRGEWERLAIEHVHRRLPQVREPYIAQARRTLRRAYDAGDRDPRLLATMGLCEIDARNPAGAGQYLEPAVAAGVARPRAYFELALLRFDELRRDAPETKAFSFTELAPVIQPLQRAVTQAPPLPEVFMLLAEAWARCELAPSPAEFAALALGARLFAQNASVAYPIAVAFSRHGKKAEAAAVLDACSGAAPDDSTRERIRELRADLAAALAQPPAAL
ncbi:MAG: hypothetical protein JNK23_21205 [Opitutaceae bacterium]|nr:hypothetical protein [Opitutaceae bacterium]